MPTVAQILTARAEVVDQARYSLATVIAARGPGNVAGVRIVPGDAMTSARAPLDMTPVVGDTVLILIAPAATVIIARLESAS